MSRRTRPSDPTLVDGADPTSEGGIVRPVGVIPAMWEALAGPPTAAQLRAQRRAEWQDRAATARAITVDVSLILLCLILITILVTIAWRIWNREYFV